MSLQTTRKTYMECFAFAVAKKQAKTHMELRWVVLCTEKQTVTGCFVAKKKQSTTVHVYD